MILLSGLVLMMLARTDGRSKVTGLARQALMEQRRQTAADASRPLTATRERRLTAFVRLTASQADDVLRRHRCTLLAQTGDICIVSIPSGLGII